MQSIQYEEINAIREQEPSLVSLRGYSADIADTPGITCVGLYICGELQQTEQEEWTFIGKQPSLNNEE